MSLIRTAVEVISVLTITAYVLHQNRKLKSQMDIMKKKIEEHEVKISEKEVEKKNNGTVCVDGVCSVVPPPENFFQKHQLASGSFKLISK